MIEASGVSRSPSSYEVLDVRASARWVSEGAEDVRINQAGIERAAQELLPSILSAVIAQRGKPTALTDWHNHPLHPPLPRRECFESDQKFEDARDNLLHWIFVVSVLNFSFWSDSPSNRFSVRCGTKDEPWTGYWSLLAVLHRAIEEGYHQIVDPTYLSTIASDADFEHIFRSDRTDDEPIPLLDERIRVIREAGGVICESYNGKVRNLVERAGRSSIGMIALLVKEIPSFRDEAIYNGKQGEVWAAFEGEGIGEFGDVEQLTMFADYRVPQILHALEMIDYSPKLLEMLKSNTYLKNGSREEVEIRALSVMAVESMRLAIKTKVETQQHSSLGVVPSSIELDFWLWDLAKREEVNPNSSKKLLIPHHRTRSVYY